MHQKESKDNQAFLIRFLKMYVHSEKTVTDA